MPLTDHLGMSEDIWLSQKGEHATDTTWAEVRDAAKEPTMNKTTAHLLLAREGITILSHQFPPIQLYEQLDF